MATCAIALGLPGGAATQTANPKIAADLAHVVEGGAITSLGWANALDGLRYVKVLIVCNSSDTRLAALRSAVLAQGGSVYQVYDSVRAMSAMLPAAQVASIAARSDVQFVLPNRSTQRSASLLQDATGSAAPLGAGTAA